MNALLLSLALGAGALSSYPRPAGGPVSQPAAGALLDGAPAALVVAGDQLAAFRVDGTPARGFPVSLGAGEVASGAPAAADMDGDGRPELAVTTTSGKVFLWSGAAPVPGFPARLGARARAGPSFLDVDGDGRPELVVGDAKGHLHAFKKSGKEAPGFPVMLGAAVTSTASAARFAGGASLAVGCADGRVHVIDLATRKERPGFPLRTGYEVTGAPAFADLDGDGAMDLVVASQDFKLYAVSEAGRALPGFPVEAGYRIYEGPAVADLDGDGRLSVAFTSADGFLHVVDAAGHARPGFPVKLGPRVFGGAVVGDLDRDGKPDLVAVSSDGNVVAVSREGRPLAGFPTRFDAADLGATPVLIDLAGDQSLSVVIGFPNGDLHAIRALRFGTTPAAAPWPAPGRDAAHSGHAASPPRYHALTLEPPEPRTGDGLRASWRWVSLDARPGEAEPTPQLDWYRNGALVADLHGQRTVPPGRARKGEAWRFALTAPGGVAPYRSPEVRVIDTPPGAPTLALEPARPVRGGAVRVVLAKPAPDPDGDELAYRYAWLLDGVDTGEKGPVFPAERLARGKLLTVRVSATDGEAEGESAVVEARVADTAPGPVAIALEPARPRRGDAVAAKVAEPARDADGDALTYHYRWKVDGEARNLPLSTATLPPRSARKHQRVTVEVRAFDGELEGPPATDAVELANTVPGAPAVEIRPAAPRRGDALRAVLTAEAPDGDGDPLTYRFVWTKNGKPFATTGDPREVPTAEVLRGDRFEVEAWATDGEAEGPHVRATVTVGNTPPTPPRVALEPALPRGGAPLRAVMLAASQDTDGDPVRYAFAWTADGAPVTPPAGAQPDVLPTSLFRKHQRVRVTVTPSDGRDAGPAATAEVVVENAPPGAPEVELSPARATVATRLEARVVKPAPDADRDNLTYRFRWLRDGFAVPVADGGTASRKEPFWTSAAELPASELRKGQRWTVEVQAFDGEAYGPVARAHALVVNTTPPRPEVAFVTPLPRRGDGIRLALTQPPDADGDAVTYRFAWWRDGHRLSWPPEQGEVPRGVARKGERWKVEVTASDGEAEAPPVAAEVVVANTPPGAAAVSLCDRPVPSGTPIEVKLREPAQDADGDSLVYRYAWTVNGRPLETGHGHARLGAQALHKHDLARVVVTAFDGAEAGPEAAAECLVENTPPTRPEIALEPREPTALTGLKVVVRQPATDRDEDPVSYHYQWLRDGLPAPAQGPEVAPGALRHGEVWEVVVRAFDGEEEGEPATASARVRNTPPPAPAVAIRPEQPVTGQALSCEASAPAEDADKERIELRYRWLRNGEPIAVAEGSASLPAGVARRGERWRCEAWASDGTADSPRARAEVTVKNSPPGAPQVVVEPEAPHRDDPLVCRIAVDAVDPDGDRLGYRYAWSLEGQPQPAGPDPSRIAPDRLKKGQRWRCVAVATDGELEGSPGRAEQVVLNTPPGPARVRIAPAAPRAGAALRCEVAEPAKDPDGDPIRYHFTWLKNGEVQPFSDVSEEVPARLVRAGDRWRCQVTPSDGEANGPSSGSPDVVVIPPGESRVSAVRSP
jgi:hypothetical protein